MKSLKNFLFITLSVFLLVLVSGCGKEPTVITLKTESNVTIRVEEKLDIEYTVSNPEKEDQVKIEIDNTDVAKLEGKTLTALKTGTVNVSIMVIDEPDSKVTVKVTIDEKPSISITGPDKVVTGKSIKLEAVLVGLEGDVTWKVSDSKLATIENGVLQAIKPGTVTVTAKLHGKTAEHTVVISKHPVVSITGPEEVRAGGSIQLKGYLDYAEGELVWTSSDTNLATVEDGKVTALNEGTVKIKATFGEYFREHEITILPRAIITVTGKLEVNQLQTTALSAKMTDYNGSFNWTSLTPDILKVDNTGLVTGLLPGVGKVKVSADSVEKIVEITVKKIDGRIQYNFDGGVSKELYTTQKPTGTVQLTSYNSASGGFWGGYPTNIYIYTKSADPHPTFSDRIYIGKNEFTGLFEVKGIIMSGPSKWAEGASYVIILSNQHENYYALHDLLRNVQVGDVFVNPKPLSSIHKDNTADCAFYNPKVTTDQLVVTPDQYNGTLITPVKLGCKFLGWYDENDKKVESIPEINSIYNLTAKWQPENPVTDITFNDIPKEIKTGESFKVNASVVPSNAFFKDVFFETSNRDIFTVDVNGLITTINAGKATLTMRDYASQVVKTVEINVIEVPSIDVKFDHYFNGVLNVNDKVQLNPTFVGKAPDNFKFTYTTSDDKVLTVTEAGEVQAIKNGTATITIKVGTEYTLEVGLTVNGLTTETKVDEVIKLLAENNFATVETGNMSLYDDGKDKYYKATYGSVNRYLFDELTIHTDYVDTAVNNPNCHKDRRAGIDTIEFVTVHDTATLTAGPKNIAANMSSGETSIHYTVGDRTVYQVVPEKYIAYHAGDGTHHDFKWTDTGVKANGNNKPDYDLVQEGNKYLLKVNGTKTNIIVPTSGYRNDNPISIENPTKDDFCDLKPVYTIKNGNYYVGPMWACFSQTARGAICSRGGNNNSIGIEMCVNTVGDMYDTLQRTALLVSDIMIRNNLGLERVQKHNSWSGKNCPQVERTGDYWDDFMKMVTLQYTINKDYKDVEISMKSNNPDIVDNTGRVIKHPMTTTSVSYEVTVKLGDVTKTITLYSVIPGTTQWQQWNGIYPSSRVWNNGYFPR